MHRATSGSASDNIIGAQAEERNLLLRLLPEPEYLRLREHLTPVHLVSGMVLSEPNERITEIYFPRSCVLSLIYRFHDGAVVEVGTVGNEGMSGLPLFLGIDSMPVETIAQVPGDALRMSASAFLSMADQEDGQMHDLLHRYTQGLMMQVSQTAACNGMHTVEERCARWILMTDDRVGGTEFHLTQEFLSYMLGVRRPGVTVAAASLQRAGLIRYRRGRMAVQDRRGLEKASCECYGVVRAHFERLFS